MGSVAFGKSQLFCLSALHRGNQVAVRQLFFKQTPNPTNKQELELAKVPRHRVPPLYEYM